MILTKEHIDYFKKRSDVELFKVMKSYFVDGVVNSVTERMNVGDDVNYMGRVTGIETQMLYNKIKSVQNSPNMFRENGVDLNARIENEVVVFVSVNKNDKGKYESDQKKMSAKSFIEICDNSIQLISSHQGIGSLTDLLNSYDEVSEEYKTVKTMIDLSKSSFFNFILYKYDSILNNQRTSIKNWSIFDSNDQNLRVEYEVKTEFKLP